MTVTIPITLFAVFLSGFLFGLIAGAVVVAYELLHGPQVTRKRVQRIVDLLVSVPLRWYQDPNENRLYYSEYLSIKHDEETGMCYINEHRAGWWGSRKLRNALYDRVLVLADEVTENDVTDEIEKPVCVCLLCGYEGKGDFYQLDEHHPICDACYRKQTLKVINAAKKEVI